MLKKLLRGKKIQTLKKTFYDLKLIKKFLVEERHEIREIVVKIIPIELDDYLNQFVFAARTKAEKDYEPSSLCGITANVERH